MVLENDLRSISEYEEYETLSTELHDLKSDISELKSNISSQFDSKQSNRPMSQHQRDSDIFKWAELISSTSNWITTVELKLASDDDNYLDDAVTEDESYKILLKEAKSNATRIQECCESCQSCLKSNTEDTNIKDILSTLANLDSQVHQLIALIKERLQALQVNPPSTTHVTDIEILDEQLVPSIDIPTVAHLSSDEKAVQTSLSKDVRLGENVETQTSNTCDITDCSDEPSTFTSDEPSSLDSTSIFDKNETPVEEISHVQLTTECYPPEYGTSPLQFVDEKEEKEVKPKAEHNPKTETEVVIEPTHHKEEKIPKARSPIQDLVPVVEIPISGGHEPITYVPDVKQTSRPTEVMQVDPNKSDVDLEFKHQLHPITLAEISECIIATSDIDEKQNPVLRYQQIVPSSRPRIDTVEELITLKTVPKVQNSPIHHSSVLSSTPVLDSVDQVIPVKSAPIVQSSASHLPSDLVSPASTEAKLPCTSSLSVVPEALPVEEAVDPLSQTITPETKTSTVRVPSKALTNQSKTDQGVQSSFDLETEAVPKSDKATATSSRISKKKIKRRSDTVSFAETLVTVPGNEAVMCEMVEEDVEEEKASLSQDDSIWDNANYRIEKRIHDEDTPSLSTLFLKPNVTTDELETSIDKFKDLFTTAQTRVGEKQNVAVVKKHFVDCAEYVSNLLEDVEHQILELKQSSHRTSPEDQISTLKAIKSLKDVIDNSCLEPLSNLSTKVGEILSPSDTEKCKTICQMLTKQSQSIDKLHALNNDKVVGILYQWQYFLNQIRELHQLILILKKDVHKVIDEGFDGTLEEQLDLLEAFLTSNDNYISRISTVMPIAEKVIFHLPNLNIPEEVYVIYNETRVIECSVCGERDKVLQIINLIQEYEQTLNEFTQIMDIAEELMVLPISVSSLAHLQEEMQNHRRFFINLNHCKTILESLEGHLDNKTRQKYYEQHSELITRASEILDKASVLSQQMALTASRWLVINKRVADESTWLQVAQHRLPDLSTVKSTDYQQFTILFQSLASDVYKNLARISQLTDSVHGLRKIVSCPELEFGYNKYKEEATALRNTVNNQMYTLEIFDDNWTRYNVHKEKVILWMDVQESTVATFTPTSNMRKFWHLQAQIDVYKKINDIACKHFNTSVVTVKLLDEEEQKQTFEEFQTKWKNFTKLMNEVQNKVTESFASVDTPTEQRLSSIEAELAELIEAFSDCHEAVEDEEQFQLYLNKVQVMQKALHRAENELGCHKLLTVPQCEKIGTLINKTRVLEEKINEEVDNAMAFEDHINEINEKIREINREQSRCSTTMDQCENSLNLRQDDIIQAMSNCEIINSELETQWQEITKLCQLFHTLPKRLNVTVSLPTMEQSITLIRNNHEKLDSRCKWLMSVLKERVDLWKNFSDHLRCVKQSVEEVDFMMDLIALHGTVDYQRLAAVTENLQDLSEGIEQREADSLCELDTAAKRLKAVCNEEISNEIDSTVDESVGLWNESKKSLRKLCDRYQHAVNIWTVYRKNSDIVNEWVDNQLNSLTNLPVEEAVNQLQIYDQAINEQSEKLVELRGMVMEIASEVGVNEDSLLTGEIILLTKKLEEVKAALITLNNVTDNDKRKMIIEEVAETENCISSVKESSSFSGNAKSTRENVEQIHVLQNKLHLLTHTDAVINHLKEEQAEILSHPLMSVHREKIPVVELLESWQDIFRETFREYHRIFTSIAGDQDCLEAVKLWKDYLMSIQEFLLTKIPDNYDNLSSDQQMCQMHESLLTSQNSILLNEKSKRSSLHLSEQLNLLTALHNETLSNIKQRHDEVKRRLQLWQRYREDQKILLSWLRKVENEQTQLNLRYLRLRTINTNLKTIEDLLKRIPQGEELVKNLLNQHEDLLAGCSVSVRSSVKIELDSADKRIRNIEAALKTWLEFISKIKSTHDLYEASVAQIEDMFHVVSVGIEKEIRESNRVTYVVADVQNQLLLLKNYQKKVLSMDENFLNLLDFEEKLKEAIDTKDVKPIKQKNWLLKHQHDEIKYELMSLVVKVEERLAVWDNFHKRRLEFLTWAHKLDNRLEHFSLTLNFPEVVLRRLNLEYCSEVDAKRTEFEWLMKTGAMLSQYESEELAAEHYCGMLDKTEEINSVWQKVNNDTKGEVEKVKNIIKELKNLTADSRQLILWMRKMSSDLNKIVSLDHCDKNALQAILDDHEVIDREIRMKEPSISGVINRGEIFIMDCESCNISLDIKTFMLNFDMLERRWNSLQMDCIETKDRIFTVWKLIQEVLNVCHIEEPWLTEQENQCGVLQKRCETVLCTDIHSLIERAKVLSDGVNNHATQFKLLEELLYSELLAKNHIQDMSVARRLLQRYSALKKDITMLVDVLNTDLEVRKEFESCHANLILRLSQLDAKLTQLQHLDESDGSGAKDIFREKFDKLKILNAEHESLKGLIKQADLIKSKLMVNEKRSDLNSIQNTTEEYTSMHKEIRRRIKTLKNYYQKQLSNKPTVDEEIQVETLKFEKDFAAQVDTLPTTMQRKDAFLYELQNTMKESKDHIEELTKLANTNKNEEITKTIACCQSSLDLVKHLSAVLESQCNVLPTDVTLAQVQELATRYQQLVTSIRFRQQEEQQQRLEENSELGRLRCPLCSQRNWSQLNNDIWRLEKWLDHAEGTLQANPASPPENIEQLEDVIQDQKEFMMYLDSHRDVIVSLNIVGKHLMEHSDSQTQSVDLQGRLALVNERWEKVCAMAMVWQTKLQTALMENNEFLDIIGELLEWIERTEHSIKSYEPVDLTEETPIIRNKYNKFKRLHRELKKCEPRIVSLQAANQVCASQHKEEFEHLQNKLDHLQLRLQTLVRVTWVYLLKLGAVLGYDTNDITSAVDLQMTSSMTTSQELLDENFTEPAERPDTPQPQSSVSNSDEESGSVLTRSHRFFGRVIRAALPIQAFFFVVLGVVSLFPRVDEEYSCATANNMAWSLQPILRYPLGPPPT